MFALKFQIRLFLRDLIRFALLLIFIVGAVIIGVALFAVGLPLLWLMLLALALSAAGFYVDPSK
jgi:uncharacterized membrane protein YoaK (UPF0700 family)